MANIKFSQFTQKTTIGNVDFLVGYTGAQNIQVDPVDLLSGYSQGTGAAGQVTFFSAASTVTGDNDFYWDNTNKRLGIGTATPGNKLEVQVTSNGHGVLFKSNTTQIGSILRTAIGGTVSMTIDGAGTRPININNSSSSNVLIANGGGNVGIGTTSPGSKLQVNGTFANTGIAQIGSTGANVLLTSSSAGNVGIGITSPSEKLEVNGNILVNKGTTNRTAYVSDDGLYISRTTVANSYTSSITADSSSSGNNLNIKARSRIDLILNGNTTLVADDSGRVGIGTTSPGVPLDVFGSDGIRTTTNSGAFAAGYFAQLHSDYGSNALRLKSRAGDVFRATDFGQAVSILTGTTSSGTSERMRITSAGNVGIGTTSPNANLEIDGGSSNAFIQFTTPNTNYAGIRFGDPQSINAGRIQYYHGAGALEFDTEVRFVFQGGNVGIGTDSPQGILNIFKNSSTAYDDTSDPGQASSGSSLTIQNGNTTVNSFSQVNMQVSSDSNRAVGRIVTIAKGGASSDMAFVTENAGVRGEKMRILANGNVGIGTTSATAKLNSISPDGSTDSLKLGRSDASSFWNFNHAGNDLRIYNSDGSGSDILIGVNAGGTIYDNKVGIGTASPANKLDVNGIIAVNQTAGGNAGIKIITRNDAEAFLIMGDPDDNSMAGIAYNNSTNSLSIDSNNAERISIDSSGNVGIGSTSPTSKLTVAVGDIETSGVGYGLILKSPNGTRYRVTVDNSGNLSTTAV